MSDFFLELGKNPNARKVINSLGLPLPMPQDLKRARDPWEARPLAGKTLVVGAADGAEMLGWLVRTLAVAGAEARVPQSSLLAAFDSVAEAYGRPARLLDLEGHDKKTRLAGFVFDATGITTPAQLDALYDFFHPLMRQLAKCGRVVVVGRDPGSFKNAAHASAQAALEGFVRSAAKELGKKGSTANLLYVQKGAEDRVEGPLRWLLSPRSAFVSGQPIHVSKNAADNEEWDWVKPIDGKVVLLTGAARGIGKATAKLLAAEGAHVVCLDRPQDDQLCSQVARDIGGSVLLADVSDPGAPAAIASDLQQRCGKVDIVVHNAGVTRDKTLARMKKEHWDQALDINLAAVSRITDALVDGPLNDDGRIICLSSVAGIAGNMGQTNYAASKSGIIGFVGAYSKSLAKRGITVNAIAPGFIETRLTAAIPVVIREAARRLSNLGQGGQPQDVGEAITFLSSPGAIGITGRVVRVCGGALVGA
jgi:3-oxoacyl-[acyl-carrier protein] reductase